MRTSTDIGQQVQKPEYRQALQELIKYELQALVERLSETGEEALVLTASLQDGTSTQLASPKAEGFLIKQKTLSSKFLSYFNEDGDNSSGDELCTFDEEIDIEASSSLLTNLKSGMPQYTSTSDNGHAIQEKISCNRPRERTTSRHLSLSREDKTAGNIYEVSQTSDVSVSDRNDSASSVSSFVEARDQDNDVSSLQCKICNRTFRSFKTLNLHIRRHIVKSYKCNFCGKIFSVKSSYQRHIKTHNKKKVFDCGFCNKSFADQLLWKQHRERHFGARNYSCNVCGKAFYEKYSLKVHQTSHFISTQKSEKNIDSNAGYSCHICQKLSKTKAALKNHILTHSAKKYACEFCNKRFSLKFSYIRHRRIHTGEKPYKCGSCGKPFSDSSAWAKHVRTHSGVKPYSCDICAKTFYDKTACKTHLKIHERKVRKQCEQENQNFNILSNERINDGYSDKLLEESLSETTTVERKYESHTGNNDMFVQLSLQLDESDKEFDNSNLLDSGFGADLIGNDEETVSKTADRVSKNQMSPILDSVELDEKFQQEFVERNMPIKGIESDCELISTTFPDEAELLEETEPENLSETTKKPSTFNLQKPEKNTGIPIQPQSPLLPKSARRSATKRSSGKKIPESPLKCKKCRKTFKQESLLKQHLQFHCMMKLYKCRYCGKQLSTKHSLVRHERIHVGERPYQCYLCQKTFADNYSCIRHVKKHFNNDNRNISPASTTKNSRSSSQITSKLSTIEPEKVALSLGISDYSKNSTVFQQSYCHTQTDRKTEKSSLPAAVPSESKKNETETISKSPSQLTSVGHQTDVGSNESKSLYRCYSCSSLFPTQQQCIDHIQQKCNKNVETEFISVPHEVEDSVDSPQLKNIYQCSVCKMMFNEENVCRIHQAQNCHKQKNSRQFSLLQDTMYTSASKNDLQDLPSLPFPHMNAGQPLLDINEDVMLLPNTYHEAKHTETKISGPPSGDKSSSECSSAFITFDHMATLSNTCANISFVSTSAQDTSPRKTEINFTGLVSKPITVPEGKYLFTSQGLSLVNASNITSVLTSPLDNIDNKSVGGSNTEISQKKKSPGSNIAERTCTMCNKTFTNKHILKQHVLIHMERKFGCKYCLKKFHNKYGRDRHERIHTGEKPYSCPSCRKAFSDNSTYRKHTRICCSGK